MIDKMQDKKIKNLTAVLGVIILIILFFRYSIVVKTEFVYDVVASTLIVAIFFIFYDKLHQDCISYFFLMFALIIHNLGIYATSPFGIRFDHYMHFFGGFTIAIIGDRIFNEKFSRGKRFVFVVIFALGIGAIGEILEWIGYGILGKGDGFFFFGMGDEGEWRNSMLDLIFNFIGGTFMGILTLFRKIKQ